MCLSSSNTVRSVLDTKNGLPLRFVARSLFDHESSRQSILFVNLQHYYIPSFACLISVVTCALSSHQRF
jgi:hypothetical protein